MSIGDSVIEALANAQIEMERELVVRLAHEEKWHRRYLDVAKLISTWSKDPSTKTGSVIVTARNRLCAAGYNGFAEGVDDSPERYANRELKYKMIVHCEENAVIIPDRHSLEGATLYTYPFMSCAKCAGLMIQAGIKRVVAPINKEPRWAESFILSTQEFKEAGVEILLIDYV